MHNRTKSSLELLQKERNISIDNLPYTENKSIVEMWNNYVELKKQNAVSLDSMVVDTQQDMANIESSEPYIAFMDAQRKRHGEGAAISIGGVALGVLSALYGFIAGAMLKREYFGKNKT